MQVSAMIKLIGQIFKNLNIQTIMIMRVKQNLRKPTAKSIERQAELVKNQKRPPTIREISTRSKSRTDIVEVDLHATKSKGRDKKIPPKQSQVKRKSRIYVKGVESEKKQPKKDSTKSFTEFIILDKEMIEKQEKAFSAQIKARKNELLETIEQHKLKRGRKNNTKDLFNQKQDSLCHSIAINQIPGSKDDSMKQTSANTNQTLKINQGIVQAKSLPSKPPKNTKRKARDAEKDKDKVEIEPQQEKESQLCIQNKKEVQFQIEDYPSHNATIAKTNSKENIVERKNEEKKINSEQKTGINEPESKMTIWGKIINTNDLITKKQKKGNKQTDFNNCPEPIEDKMKNVRGRHRKMKDDNNSKTYLEATPIINQYNEGTSLNQTGKQRDEQVESPIYMRRQKQQILKQEAYIKEAEIDSSEEKNYSSKTLKSRIQPHSISTEESLGIKSKSLDSKNLTKYYLGEGCQLPKRRVKKELFVDAKFQKINIKAAKTDFDEAIEMLQEYSLPEEIPCRESEKKEISDFLNEGLNNNGSSTCLCK